MLAIIEQALLSALRDALTGTLRIASYAGELDRLTEAVPHFPSVWLAYTGTKPPKRLAARLWKHQPSFTVFIGVRNLRGEAAARLGGPGAEIGAYELQERIQHTLVGNDFDLPIAPIVPGAVKVLFNGALNNQAITVLVCEFLVEYSSRAQIFDTILPEVILERIHIGLQVTPSRSDVVSAMIEAPAP